MSDFFSNLNYPNETKELASGFLDDIFSINCLNRIENIRRRLNDLVHVSPKNMGLISCVIYAVKARQKELLSSEYMEDNNNGKHIMTDHAFVQYMRRGLGLDIESCKDKALLEIKSADHLIPVYSKGKILTVVSKRKYQAEDRD